MVVCIGCLYTCGGLHLVAYIVSSIQGFVCMVFYTWHITDGVIYMVVHTSHCIYGRVQLVLYIWYAYTWHSVDDITFGMMIYGLLCMVCL